MPLGFDITALGNVVHQILNGADAVEAVLNRLNAVSSEYTFDWKGVSRQQYEEKLAELRSRLEALINKTFSLSNAINSLMSEFTQSDQA